MKETTWSKLRELWAIRQHCKQISREGRRQARRTKSTDQTTGGFYNSALPTVLAKVRFENI
jgi:hypothetical protein